MSNENPLDALRIVIQKLQEAIEPLGLEVLGSAVQVGSQKGMPDVLQIMLKVDPELLTKTDQERQELEMLRGIERATMVAQREEKEAETIEAAQRLARDLQDPQEKGGLW